jgi:hypothetical protein
MERIIYHAGAQLNEVYALQFAKMLAGVNGAAELEIDFSETQHFEPFSMLFVGSALRQAQRRANEAGGSVHIRPEGIDPEGIAAHMGFWRSVGLDIGREINAVSSKDSYVGVSCLDVAKTMRDAGGVLPLAISHLEQEAGRLAQILTPDANKGLYDALRYSLREILRNGLEHASSPFVWFAGMSWPRRDFVQIAVLDEGRGIKDSLNSNELYHFSDDISAIDAALLPGVTRNANKKLTRTQIEKWHEARLEHPVEFYQNSGYGLYMVSEIARAAGQFTLASGMSARQYISASMHIPTVHQGTAMRVTLIPSKAGVVVDEVFGRIAGKVLGGEGSLLTASMQRRLLSRMDTDANGT